jgi:predicted transcriptional regulator
MYNQMSNQDTGKTPILKVRVRRREKLSPEEWEAFKKIVKGPDAVQDLAEQLDLARGTLYNIFNNGVGHSDSVNKIRAFLSAE